MASIVLQLHENYPDIGTEEEIDIENIDLD